MFINLGDNCIINMDQVQYIRYRESATQMSFWIAANTVVNVKYDSVASMLNSVSKLMHTLADGPKAYTLEGNVVSVDTVVI